MKKKAQGISINTIIIAAIALLVLVIVAIIFMARMGWFTQNTNDCKKFNGECDHGSKCLPGYMEHSTAICYDGNEKDPYNICCVKELT